MPDLSMLAFGAIALMMIVAALMMVITRNVVHSAYWLFAIAVLTAGMFGLLHAGFVAVIQLLIYAGAVAILTVFTVMLTMRDPNYATRSREFNLPALAMALILFGLVVGAVLTSDGITVQTVDDYPGIQAFAERMFAADGWALPFEVASLILTTALVTAVMWTKAQDNQEKNDQRQDIQRQDIQRQDKGARA